MFTYLLTATVACVHVHIFLYPRFCSAAKRPDCPKPLPQTLRCSKEARMPKTRPLSQQRKRRVRVSKAASFPVPIATVTGESAGSRNWFFYTAVLEDDSVVVRHSGDMDFLYRMVMMMLCKHCIIHNNYVTVSHQISLKLRFGCLRCIQFMILKQLPLLISNYFGI